MPAGAGGGEPALELPLPVPGQHHLPPQPGEPRQGEQEHHALGAQVEAAGAGGPVPYDIRSDEHTDGGEERTGDEPSPPAPAPCVIPSGAVLALALGGLVLKKEGARRVISLGVTVGTLAMALLAVWTGHSGGELVYSHGAASVASAQERWPASTHTREPAPQRHAGEDD